MPEFKQALNEEQVTHQPDLVPTTIKPKKSPAQSQDKKID
jgi:hypothetical protein